MRRTLRAWRSPSTADMHSVTTTLVNGVYAVSLAMSLRMRSRSWTLTARNTSRQAASMRFSGRRVRQAWNGNCRQFAKKMADAVSTAASRTSGSCARGARATAASSAADSIHKAFSVRGSDCSPKRHVKMQKHATYSTSTMALARAAPMLSANGQGLVTSTLAMNSTQNSAISAYQPKARCSRRISQMQKHSPPRTADTIRLSMNSVRLRHRRSS